jgi:hypothetical protein
MRSHPNVVGLREIHVVFQYPQNSSSHRDDGADSPRIIPFTDRDHQVEFLAAKMADPMGCGIGIEMAAWRDG